jgi:hypothetical protein
VEGTTGWDVKLSTPESLEKVATFLIGLLHLRLPVAEFPRLVAILVRIVAMSHSLTLPIAHIGMDHKPFISMQGSKPATNRRIGSMGEDDHEDGHDPATAVRWQKREAVTRSHTQRGQMELGAIPSGVVVRYTYGGGAELSYMLMQ